MRKFVLTLLLNTTLGVALAMAGGLSGPVSGTWRTGEEILITGPSYIPEGKGLIVEPGVVIRFETTDAFVIRGTFQMLGSAGPPIVIEPPLNWEGFLFQSADPTVWHRLYYVILRSESPTPLAFVVSENSCLDVRGCNFRADRFCLDLIGGSLQAWGDTLTTVGIYSKVVRLVSLRNDISNPCSHPHGNYIRSCFLRADVPIEDDTLGHPLDFTTALKIETTNSICLSDSNVFFVQAPKTAIGAHFDGQAPGGSGMTVLDLSIVTVRSLNGTPKGIFIANEGFLQILHCTIDVAEANPSNNYYAIGIVASRLAGVVMNSSSLVLDAGSEFFIGVDGGNLHVDYSAIFSSAGSIVSFYGPRNKLNELDDGGDGSSVDETVQLGPHNIFADPEWQRDGEWGEWNSFADVYAYYSLLPTSPCRDAADSQWGYDPDNSLPDIGCYYYQTMAVDPSNASIPTVIEMKPAYPNPFNPVSVLPLELKRSGHVDIAVFDLLGRKVVTVYSGMLAIGSHRITFSGENLASGVFLVAVRFDGRLVAIQKVTLLK
jgi:hypothetical protein